MKMRWTVFFSSILIALAVTWSGCRSTPTQAGGFLASVQIDDHSRAAIEQAIEQVFKENHYEMVRGAPEYIFDKPASKMGTLAYSSWSGKPVFARTKVTIRNDGFGGFIVGCNAYMVRDRGDPIFEEEQKTIKFSSSDYQKLMDDVKKRVGSPAP
jgi:hypothetical protein